MKKFFIKKRLKTWLKKFAILKIGKEKIQNIDLEVS